MTGIVLVVAMTENRVIGRDGGLPFRLPSDLRRFKQLTLGKPVVMGRKTWTSIGRPLPGRENIVVTRDPDFVAEGARVVASVEAALAAARAIADQTGEAEIAVIGGGEIYRQTIGRADRIEATEVDAVIEGDTVFPAIDPDVFERIAEGAWFRGEKDSHSMRFVTWRRR
ncbi:dihydrofolate reductase [Ensifer soli]|uniref:dihydrofolate reductase n=1 Tax=Ciceribacter sp. sgz301302 TaxID=3342379 RepID=UPI0035B8EFAB